MVGPDSAVVVHVARLHDGLDVRKNYGHFHEMQHVELPADLQLEHGFCLASMFMLSVSGNLVVQVAQANISPVKFVHEVPRISVASTNYSGPDLDVDDGAARRGLAGHDTEVFERFCGVETQALNSLQTGTCGAIRAHGGTGDLWTEIWACTRWPADRDLGCD